MPMAGDKLLIIGGCPHLPAPAPRRRVHNAHTPPLHLSTMSNHPSPRFEPFVHVDGALWRQRVMDGIRHGAPASARLTLLSAPAGFGKTTVLAQLAKQARDAGGQVTWL